MMTDSSEYEQLKEALKNALKKRKQYQDEFNKLEQEIYDKETEYFSNVNPQTGHNTAVSLQTVQGNIIKGFDGFSKTLHHHSSTNQSSHGNAGNNTRELSATELDPLNTGLPNKDRIFSLSDIDFVKQLQQDDLLPGFDEDAAVASAVNDE
mgnify:CR=1 FL=1